MSMVKFPLAVIALLLSCGCASNNSIRISSLEREVSHLKDEVKRLERLATEARGDAKSARSITDKIEVIPMTGGGIVRPISRQ